MKEEKSELMSRVTYLNKKVIILQKNNNFAQRQVDQLKTELEVSKKPEANLREAIDKAVFSQYHSRQSRKLIAKDFCEILFDDSFLNGECKQFVTRNPTNARNRDKSLGKQNSVPPEGNQKSLSQLIEEEYLSGRFKAGTHATTKASHVFNELWSSEFLKGAMDKIARPIYEEKIREENPYNQPELVVREMDLSGGVVNQSCINVLRRVERLGKYGRNAYMVSTNSIKKLQERCTSTWTKSSHTL